MNLRYQAELGNEGKLTLPGITSLYGSTISP